MKSSREKASTTPRGETSRLRRQRRKGVLGDLKVQVSPEDDRGFEDCQYWVTLKGPVKSPTEFEKQVEVVVLKLLRAGHRVYQSMEERPDHIVRIAYFLDPSGTLGRKREEIALPQTAHLSR